MWGCIFRANDAKLNYTLGIHNINASNSAARR